MDIRDFVKDSLSKFYQKSKTVFASKDEVEQAKEIFHITREVTTYDEIMAAVTAGKLCMMYGGDDVYTVTYAEDGKPIRLYCYDHNSVYGWRIEDDDTWNYVERYDTDNVIKNIIIGSSTFQEIWDAVNAGMFVVGRRTGDAMDDTLWTLISIFSSQSSQADFVSFDLDEIKYAKCVYENGQNSWSYDSYFIPTSLDQLSDDSTHRTVTDAEKTTWNGYGTAISGINDKIPAQASSENQLADKDFVNSSVSTATATFRGTFTSLQTLQATNGDKNDYAFYNHTDSAGNAIYDRYKYVGPPVDRLPDGYTEKLYLRKGRNVTAYIDTGYKIQSTDKIYIKCYGWEYEATEYIAFGASDSNGKN